MDALRFRNIIASLFNIDRDELETAGVIEAGSAGDDLWVRFANDPARTLLRLDDDRLAAL